MPPPAPVRFFGAANVGRTGAGEDAAAVTHVFREESRLEGVDYVEWLKNPTPVKARCDGVRGVAL